ncbi:MAG: bis(5'-nucleosyl)-tetraphosphatase (symmetrical) YqeK [Bacillus sp. (in: firmicutes)]
MNREQALEIAKQHLPEKRFIHTVGVMDTAVVLAERFGADSEKAALAAIFHDYCKYRPLPEMKQVIEEEGLPSDLLAFHSELWHGPAGSVLAKKEYGITDEEVLSAIRYHTTGRAGMSLLEKIIFLADYIEPGRDFSGLDEVRRWAEINLDKAVLMALKNTIIFLASKQASIYPDTFYAYNELLIKVNEPERMDS